MVGDKEHFLVICTARKSRALKIYIIYVKELSVIWKSNRKAQMTSEFMEEWL